MRKRKHEKILPLLMAMLIATSFLFAVPISAFALIEPPERHMPERFGERMQMAEQFDERLQMPEQYDGKLQMHGRNQLEADVKDEMPLVSGTFGIESCRAGGTDIVGAAPRLETS